MKSILWYIHLVLSLLLTLPKRIHARHLKKIGDKENLRLFACQVAKNFAQAQVRFSGSQIHISGEERIPADGAVLFVCNHQSNFDLGVLIGYIQKPKGYIAKNNMEKIPILSRWMQDLDCVFMDRSDIRQAAQAILKGVQILKSGYSLVVFPEGTRSKGPQMGAFKSGSFKLATKSKAPIIPVTINGTYHIMEANHNRIRPAHIDVVIHPPIPTEGLSREEQKALPDKVYQIILSALPQSS